MSRWNDRRRRDGTADLAEPLVEKVLGGEEFRVVWNDSGKHLKGKPMPSPLCNYLLPDKTGAFCCSGGFCYLEDGTGLVHIAPAFGADDEHGN